MVLKLIKKLLNKKTMMAETEQKKQEVFLVWSKTEKAGKIVQFDENQVDPKWAYFTDGSRIDKKLINEFLLRTTSLAEAKRMSQTLGFDPSIQADLPMENLGSVTPAPILEASPLQQAHPMKAVEEPKQAAEQNIMMAMLEKMSKKNKAAMSVEVNLPSRDVYDMLIDQMDVESDELNEQIVLLIENQIDNMKQTLKEQIQLFTNNYYNGRTNTTTTSKQENAQSNSASKRDSKTS